MGARRRIAAAIRSRMVAAVSSSSPKVSARSRICEYGE
jgi:hypothetical protein